jgi:hypothetical protein
LLLFVFLVGSWLSGMALTPLSTSAPRGFYNAPFVLCLSLDMLGGPSQATAAQPDNLTVPHRSHRVFHFGVALLSCVFLSAFWSFAMALTPLRTSAPRGYLYEHFVLCLSLAVLSGSCRATASQPDTLPHLSSVVHESGILLLNALSIWQFTLDNSTVTSRF